MMRPKQNTRNKRLHAFLCLQCLCKISSKNNERARALCTVSAKIVMKPHATLNLAHMYERAQKVCLTAKNIFDCLPKHRKMLFNSEVTCSKMRHDVTSLQQVISDDCDHVDISK